MIGQMRATLPVLLKPNNAAAPECPYLLLPCLAARWLLGATREKPEYHHGITLRVSKEGAGAKSPQQGRGGRWTTQALISDGGRSPSLGQCASRIVRLDLDVKNEGC